MTRTRIIFVVAGLIVALAILFSFFRKEDDSGRTIALSEVIAAGQDGRLESVDVAGSRIEVRLMGDDTLYRSRIGLDTDITSALLMADIPVGEPDGVRLEFDRGTSGASLIVSVVPLILIPVVVYFAVYWAVRNAMRNNSREA